MSNIIEDFSLVTNQSLDASFNSNAVDIRSQNMVGIAYQAADASSLNGTLTVQVSNDKNTWVNFGSYTVTLNANANGVFSVYPCPFSYIRLAYTRTGGTGTLNVQVGAKGV